MFIVYNIDYSSPLTTSVFYVSLVFGTLFLVFIIVTMIALWKVYKKAGKGGWESLIPIYSYWVLTEITGLNWWWFLLAIADNIVSLVGLESLEFIASVISLVATFNIYYNLAKKFNKSNGMAICTGIFSTIFILIFGFSKKEMYNAEALVSKNGIFDFQKIDEKSDNK